MFYVFLQKLALNAASCIMDKHVLVEKLNGLFAKLHQPSFITTIQALFNNEEKKMSLLVEKQFSPFPVARDICLPIFAK